MPDWKKKTLAYQLSGAGKPKNMLTEAQKAERRKKHFERGPVGVWLNILGPRGAKVAAVVGAGLIVLYVTLRAYAHFSQ